MAELEIVMLPHTTSSISDGVLNYLDTAGTKYSPYANTPPLETSNRRGSQGNSWYGGSAKIPQPF